MATVTFSPLNTFRFIPNTSQINNRTNTNNNDFVQFAKQRLNWQDKLCYSQKIQSSDILSVIIEVDGYILGTMPYNSRIELVNEQGTVVKQIALQQFTASDTFFTAFDNGFFSDIPEGYYFLRLVLWRIEYPIINVFDEYVSEPLYVKDKHEGTVLLKYSNYFNILSMPFEFLPLRNYVNGIYFRVDGAIIEFVPQVERAVFSDQNMNSVPLKSMASRQYRFYVGGNGEIVPEWVIDKINQIFTCSDVTIDNTFYTVNDNSQLELETALAKGKYGASIVLTQGNQQDVYTFNSDSADIQILDLSQFSYPYLVENIYMNSTIPNYLPFEMGMPICLTNTTGRTILLNYLNSILGNWGGQFVLQGDVIIYQNDNSIPTFNVGAEVINSGLRIEGVRLGTNPANNMGIRSSSANNNATYVTQIVLSGVENPSVLSIPRLGVDGSYYIKCPNVGTNYILVFFRDQWTDLSLMGIEIKSCTSFGGAMNELLDLLIDSAGSSFEFDLRAIKGDIFWKLETVRFIDCVINNPFATFDTTPSTLGWWNLRALRFDGGSSEMSASNIDAFINDMYNSDLNFTANHPFGQHLFDQVWNFNLNLLGLNNIPTSASLVARNYLQTTLNFNIQF